MWPLMERSLFLIRPAAMPDDQNVLHFWVIDPEHPENNPSDLPGGY